MHTEKPLGPAPQNERIVGLIQLAQWRETDAKTLRDHVDEILATFDDETVHGLSLYLNELHAAIGE